MKRHQNNPIISRDMIPDIYPELVDVTSVFNPGAIKFEEEIKLMLRVQNRGRETFFVMASSKNGYDFEVEKDYVKWQGLDTVKEKIFHIYDPRITCLDKTYFIMFAMDLESGCRLGLGKTYDFREFEFMGIVSEEDNRNGVLFPEKINGLYYRFDRPNRVQLEDGPLTGSTICISTSKELLNWQYKADIISGRSHYWDELIGAGPPPIKTREGWLLIYHGIAMHYQPIYQAGVLLLDLHDPSKVVSRGRCNILEPRELYETVGQVPNVVFPTGLICDQVSQDGFVDMNSSLLLYYGAADTSVCLAEASVKELIDSSKQS